MQNLGIIESDPEILNAYKDFFSTQESFNTILAVKDLSSFIHWYRPYMEVDILLFSITPYAGSLYKDFQKLKKLIPELKIIAISEMLEEGIIFKALRAGVYGYLLKEDSLQEMASLLEEVASGGSPLSPLVANIIVRYFHPVVDSPRDLDFSQKETIVIKLLIEGYSYKEIAKHMDVKLPNVSYYIKSIYRKLGVHSKIEVMKKFNEGLLKI